MDEHGGETVARTVDSPCTGPEISRVGEDERASRAFLCKPYRIAVRGSDRRPIS